MRKTLLTLALIFLSAMAYAQSCTTATCNAASANESDVLAALPAPGNTNPTVTVNIPSGTGTWTTGFAYTVPAAVTSLIIQGNTTVNCTGTAGTSSYACTGTDNTVFIDSYVASNQPLMNIHVGAAAFRMTGLTFQGGTLATGVTKPNGFLTFDGTSTSFRIDHSHFNTNTYTPVNSGGGMTIFTNVYGVVDHTVFDLYAQNNGVRVYNSDFGDANWAAPTSFGTSAFMYLENDVFNGGAANDCDDGGRIVIRYSTINAASSGGDQGLWQTHQMGQGTQRSRGCRAEEVYHLYVLNPNPSNNLFTVGDGGSGTGVAWNNTISAGYSFDIGFQNIREVATGHSQTAPANGIGYCGTGSSGVVSPWDGNSNSTTGYPCIDQTGRGQGDLLNGQNFPGALNTKTGTIAWPHNLREPWYVWNETIASGQVYTNPIWNGVQMFPDQAFYIPASSFNGTTGTGFGLHSARPTTCTPGPGGPFDTSPTGSYGVAYFATDDNSGNGELYACDGVPANHWQPIYQPYTYPHPLTGGTPQAAAPTASPAAGTYTSAQTVTLSTTTPSPTITFCVDTVNTCTPATTYTTTISITGPTQYIRAWTNASGFTQSSTVSFKYVIGTPQTATPVISPAGGTYPRSQTATITDATAGSTIFYTTNGTTPTTGSTVYSGSFAVSASTNIQAIATASGFSQSAVGQSLLNITSAITVEGGGAAHCAISNAPSCPVGTAFTGDAILVDASDNLGTLTAPTDGTNTYTLLISQTDSANAATGFIWVACNVPAGTYTVSLNGVTSGEWTNLHAKILANTLASSACADTGAITQGKADTTGSSTLTSGSAQTPSGNNEWVEGYGVPDNDITTLITAGTNYTLFGCLNASSAGAHLQPACPEFWNQGTATATNAPMSTNTAYDWLDISTAILPVGGSTPTCGAPFQTGPLFSGTYNAPPYVLPLNVGFTNPTPPCTMHFTSAAGTTTTAATCGSPTYSGTTSLNVTTTISVIACNTGYTPSGVTGGTWTIVISPSTVSISPNINISSGVGVQ